MCYLQNSLGEGGFPNYSSGENCKRAVDLLTKWMGECMSYDPDFSPKFHLAQYGNNQEKPNQITSCLAHNICIVSQWTAICKLVFVGVFVRVFYPVPDAFIWPLDMRSGLFKNVYLLEQLGVCICLHEQFSHFNFNSPLLLRETDYCYKTITFHSYILFEFSQFIDTCIIICVYFHFIPFCIFFYSESIYIFIFDACCFSAILVCVSYH